MSTSTEGKLTAVDINGTDYELAKGADYTGAQLKDIGGVPANETLYLKHGDSGEEQAIGDTESVKIHPNMRFESSPDGGVS
ncbi:MAG: hypothetical protein ACYCXA_06735 [Actinomycetes bacterium]